MIRPIEYDNLQKLGSFKKAVSSKESIEQFMKTAQEHQAASKVVMGASSQFLLAYEGMFAVVMAVLEFHEVRPGDAGGHRATAIGRVAADLGLDIAKRSALVRLHDSRNRVTYRESHPPVTKSDAVSMQSILGDMPSAARKLVGSV